MHLAAARFSHPLREDPDGTIRVGHSRVTLQAVVDAYQQGASPEEIALRYPVLALEQVYATISFYLANEVALCEYLEAHRSSTAAAREQAERRPTVAQLRDKLRARR
jgi:uncharacterized protein (DUF433 family)